MTQDASLSFDMAKLNPRLAQKIGEGHLESVFRDVQFEQDRAAYMATIQAQQARVAYLESRLAEHGIDYDGKVEATEVVPDPPQAEQPGDPAPPPAPAAVARNGG